MLPYLAILLHSIALNDRNTLMADQKLKYKMYDLLQQIPKSIPTKKVIAELEKEGIRERTFYSDIALTAKDDRDITATRLRIYANFFGVDILELFNTEISVKPVLARVKSSQSHGKIKNHLS